MKPIVQSATRIETRKKFKIAITGDHLCELLRSTGIEVPDGAIITFTVPGGGDWSHMAVDISAENPVEIEWETVEIT